MPNLINVNVGILGHVDSGKTSLVRALSEKISTAALDKHPQSKERGITLDLGFSSFILPSIPEHWESIEPESQIQITLVDCPGHASLIKTVIGGANIIDVVLLVIDVTKGIQTQTAECLVISELACDHLIVILNKVDLVRDKYESSIAKCTKRVRTALSRTKFDSAPIVTASAIEFNNLENNLPGISNVINAMSMYLPRPQRRTAGAPMLAVDHCFAIRGQGTIMTGTMLTGTLSIGNAVQVPKLHIERKIKSMQRFREPVNTVIQGDRVGICVTGLDASAIERCLVCSPGAIRPVSEMVAIVRKIKFYRGQCVSGGKYHCTVGHETVTATVRFLGNDDEQPEPSAQSHFLSHSPADWLYFFNNTADPHGDALRHAAYFDVEKTFEMRATLNGKSENSRGNAASRAGWVWAHVTFEHPIVAPLGALCVASRLDTDISSKSCRIAFSGYSVRTPTVAGAHSETLKPRVYTVKTREGTVDRVISQDSNFIEIVGRGLFKKETDMAIFSNFNVRVYSNDQNVTLRISGLFGKSGKFKASGYLDNPIDVQRGNLIVLEYRKSSASGVTQALQE